MDSYRNGYLILKFGRKIDILLVESLKPLKTTYCNDSIKGISQERQEDSKGFYQISQASSVLAKISVITIIIRTNKMSPCTSAMRQKWQQFHFSAQCRRAVPPWEDERGAFSEVGLCVMIAYYFDDHFLLQCRVISASPPVFLSLLSSLLLVHAPLSNSEGTLYRLFFSQLQTPFLRYYMCASFFIRKSNIHTPSETWEIERR